MKQVGGSKLLKIVIKNIYKKYAKNKKVILIKGGHTQSNLKKQADLVISAQDIKGDIAVKKSDLPKMQKSRR